MKKTIVFISLSTIMLLSSCVTTTKTARIVETKSSINNATVADLRVADQRVTYTMIPSKEVQRAGLDNVKQAALQEALTKNGNADVMVEPEYVISMKKNFMSGKKVTSITVTGRPAYYENFRTLDDSVWATPGFYGQPNVVYVDRASNKKDAFVQNGLRRSKFAFLGGLFGRKRSNDYSVDMSNSSFRRTGIGFILNFYGGYQQSKTKININDEYYGRYHDNYSDKSGFVGGLATIGLQADPQLWLGVGSGYIHGWADIVGSDFRGYSSRIAKFVPLFGNARYYFSPNKSSFFADGKLGGSFEVSHDFEGGLMFGTALGYSAGAFEIAAQYMYQKVKMSDNLPIPGCKSHVDFIGLSLGFKF